MILSLLEVLYSLRNYLLQSVLKYLDQETEHPTSDKPYREKHKNIDRVVAVDKPIMYLILLTRKKEAVTEED